MDSIVRENEEIGIGQDQLIKLVLILADKPKSEMSDLTADNADFAVNNAERIQLTCEVLRKFLVLTNNKNWFASGKNRSAIPLYVLAYHIFHSDIDNSMLPKMTDAYETQGGDCQRMKRWLRIALLNGIFSRGCGWVPYKTGINKLHGVIKKHKGKEFPIGELFQVCKNHPLHFFETVATAGKIDSFDRDYVFYLLYDCQPTVRIENVEHIHSRSRLMRAKVADEQINSIGNLALLDYVTNIRKSDLEVSVWLNSDTYVDQSTKSVYLKRHLIPEDQNLWKATSFAKFLSVRSQMIADKLNKYIQ